MGKRIVKLTESDLKRIVRRVISEGKDQKEKYVIKKVMVDKFLGYGDELRYEVFKVKRNVFGRETYKPLTYISDGDWGIPAEIMNEPPFHDIESAKSAIESDANGEYEIYIQD